MKIFWALLLTKYSCNCVLTTCYTNCFVAMNPPDDLSIVFCRSTNIVLDKSASFSSSSRLIVRFQLEFSP
jgi:hypothetical protein